jgi:hypothetical protein
MPATILKNSKRPGDFPKEAVFQHLFMEGLTSFTAPNCSICPELSKIFPATTYSNPQQVIAGEIDFFFNSSLGWGIEFLVNRDGIGEHITRFTPPMENTYHWPLMTSQMLISVEISLDKQTSFQNTQLYEGNDYSIAQCIFGQGSTPVVISLAN